MSNRLSPRNEQPGEPGSTAARKTPSARADRTWVDDAEGAQPCNARGCELTLGEVRRAGKPVEYSPAP